MVITNANIVDVVSGKVTPNRLLAISGDTVKAIDDAKKINQYKAVKYVNAQNEYEHAILLLCWLTINNQQQIAY